MSDDRNAPIEHATDAARETLEKYRRLATSAYERANADVAKAAGRLVEAQEELDEAAVRLTRIEGAIRAFEEAVKP